MIVHFCTETSGGAGAYVKLLHNALLSNKIPSILFNRNENNSKGIYSLKKISKLEYFLKSRKRTALSYTGLINDSYSLFGIERTPIKLNLILKFLKDKSPTVFIFYWLSYFIDFQIILELKKNYPKKKFVFMPMDDSLFTSACHYTNKCTNFQKICSNCPATSSSYFQTKIENQHKMKIQQIKKINPIIIYPTSNIYKTGKTSSIMCDLKSYMLPLGVFGKKEIEKSKNYKNTNKKITFLVRSSFEKRKGSDLLYEAIKLLSRNHKELINKIKVISIGDKALLKMGLHKLVNYTDYGFVSRDKLKRLYSKADATIITSRVDGGPLMINESVSLGTYVISTPVGVSKDLIKLDENGIISTNISANAIFICIKNFLQDFSNRTYNSKINNNNNRFSLNFEDYISDLIKIIY